MNPNRPSPPPVHPAAYLRHSAVAEDHRPPTMLAPQQLPTLPSIHHLHPELASSSQMSHSISSSSAHAGPSYHMSEPAREYTIRHPADDSDPDDPPGPPKKKRRRQALSCTECKRRKIKCDRNQPCGPCTRRGEQNKCQWHIIEPMEKYVTRTEYDDLRARVDYLEDIIARLPASAHTARSAPSPTLSVPSGRTAETSQATARPAYHVRGSSTSVAYHDMPLSYSPGRGEPPLPSPNAMPHPLAPQSPYTASYPEYSSRAGAAIPPSSSQARALSTSPILSSSSRLADSRVPASRRASLSLAAITTPYTPESVNQPKNRQAQTLPPLGLRLRQALALIGPAAVIPRRARKGTRITAKRWILGSRRWDRFPRELWRDSLP